MHKAFLDIVRVNGDEGTPVPIPNTVVKLIYGDNTWLATAREDNSTRTSKQQLRLLLFLYPGGFMFSYILFDLDGTLTDPREGITKSVRYALDKMGIHESDLTALEHFIGPPLYDEFMRCYGFDDAQAKQAVAFYRERFSAVGWRENILFDGVADLLQALRDAGKKVAIASSKPTVFVERILHLFEIDRFFDAVSGATLDGTIGTKSQVVEQALDMLQVADRDAAVLVGDRMHDAEGARENGIPCVGVTFGFGGLQELHAAGADVIVSSMKELQEVLLR